jgi:hypothetical protein
VKEENAETLFAGRKTKISRKVIFRYLTNSTIDKTKKITPLVSSNGLVIKADGL